MKTTAAMATAENVLIGTSAEPIMETPTLPNWVLDDGLPPPTHAQVEYWRQLCGVLSLAKGRGVSEGQWPPELAPTRPTLRVLVERGLLVRRKRAWHLKRDWYHRLCSVRQRAVPTPRQTLAARPRPDSPSYLELEAIEGICRWLDAQPRRRARLPFVGLAKAKVALHSETPAPLLHLMHTHQLVRHTSACEWALSPSWKERLLALWQGVEREVREVASLTPTSAEPSIVAVGLDTWYLNRIDLAGLPLTLRHRLDALQAQAAEDEEEVETPWLYDGAPLVMYRAGVNTAQGGGVSWSYILRNPSLALLIRRTPLGGIVAQARLGSECLWRLTPRRALEQLDALVRRMWLQPVHVRPGRRTSTLSDGARWQVSQLHLAVDVAHAPLALEQVDRYVSRSRSQAIYQAATAEVEQLLCVVDNSEDVEVQTPFAMDWDALYADGGEAFSFTPADRADEAEPEPVEDRAVTVYRFGTRISGMTFSPGGEVSMVLYDKVLHGRLRGKRHMEPLWLAAGWQPGVPVTRHEARLRRPAVRELGLVGEARSCLDDPWECLTHLGAIFAAMVGQAEECPGAVDVAWIRRVVPEEGDTNRSRWPTDPVWQVVQSATFADAPSEARRLIRRRQRGTDLAVLDRGQYGYLISRVAVGHPDGGQWTLSRALGESARVLATYEERAGKDFGELVRERRRQRGLPVPLAEKVLPFRLRAESAPDPRPVAAGSVVSTPATPATPDTREASRGRARPARPVQAERAGQSQGKEFSPPRLRVQLAEQRMADTLLQLEEAARRGASAATIAQWEHAFACEVQAYAVALKTQQAADGSEGSREAVERRPAPSEERGGMTSP